MNINPDLQRAVEEAFMADIEDHDTAGRYLAQWNEQLVAGQTPIQAAELILRSYAAASGASTPDGDQLLPAAQLTQLMETLLTELFSGPAGPQVLQVASWLWDDGATSARADDPSTVYIALSLLAVADRGGADVQDLLERTRRQMALDRVEV